MSVHEFDEKILSELERAGYVRRKDLLKGLTDKYAKQKGFSATSLNRRISELIRVGTIVTIEPKDFAEYGISDEDKRAKYLTSASYVRKKKTLDNVIAKVSDGDPLDYYLMLKEIKRKMAESPLSPIQVTRLSKILGHGKRTDEIAIEIMHNIFLRQKMCLSEEEQDSISIRLSQLLSDYRHPHVSQNKKHILDILGFFCNDIVVFQLKDDIKELASNKELLSKDEADIRAESWIKDLYHSKYLVHTLGDSIDDIIEEMWRYNEDGKKEGHEDKRKVALIVDDLLDYVAENKDKAVYNDKTCGARK